MKIINYFILIIFSICILPQSVCALISPVTNASFVVANDPDANYGDYNNIELSGVCSYVSPNTGCTYIIHLKNPMILYYPDVENITLHFYVKASYGGNFALKAFSGTNFDETTLTWNNRGLYTDVGAAAQYYIYTGEGWYTYNFTNTITNTILILQSASYSVQIRSDDKVGYEPYFTYNESLLICPSVNFSGLAYWDVVGHLQVIIAWLYSFPACYIFPIFDFIGFITGLISNIVIWFVSGLYGIISFIASMAVLSVSILGLLTGLFGDIFASNSYAAVAFGLILSGITLMFALRVYNIFAGIEIWGFKLPKL